MFLSFCGKFLHIPVVLASYRGIDTVQCSTVAAQRSLDQFPEETTGYVPSFAYAVFIRRYCDSG